jgi:hypothetical protein
MRLMEGRYYLMSKYIRIGVNWVDAIDIEVDGPASVRDGCNDLYRSPEPAIPRQGNCVVPKVENVL